MIAFIWSKSSCGTERNHPIVICLRECENVCVFVCVIANACVKCCSKASLASSPTALFDYTTAKLYAVVHHGIVQNKKHCFFHVQKHMMLFCQYKIKTDDRKKWEESVNATAWGFINIWKLKLNWNMLPITNHDKYCIVFYKHLLLIIIQDANQAGLVAIVIL